MAVSLDLMSGAESKDLNSDDDHELEPLDLINAQDVVKTVVDETIAQENADASSVFALAQAEADRLARNVRTTCMLRSNRPYCTHPSPPNLLHRHSIGYAWSMLELDCA